MTSLAQQCLNNLEADDGVNLKHREVVKQCRLTIGVCDELEKLLPGRVFGAHAPQFLVWVNGDSVILKVKSYNCMT